MMQHDRFCPPCLLTLKSFFELSTAFDVVGWTSWNYGCGMTRVVLGMLRRSLLFFLIGSTLLFFDFCCQKIHFLARRDRVEKNLTTHKVRHHHRHTPFSSVTSTQSYFLFSKNVAIDCTAPFSSSTILETSFETGKSRWTNHQRSIF